MTIIGMDDTDSREKGMCTTYVGHLVAEKIKSKGYTVDDVHLIRLNPAAKHKTRGNAAVSITTDIPAEEALEITKEIVFEHAVEDDDRTNPGIVVTEEDNPPKEVCDFTQRAVFELLDISEAEELIERYNFKQAYLGNGRGRIGSLAAIGSIDTVEDWTYEYISYRLEDVRGTKREVNHDKIFEVADKYYPEAWDTVDRKQNDTVCVPHTPGPILFGIRGDTPDAVKNLTEDLHGTTETIESAQLFKTNQGTDMHIQTNPQFPLENNRAYRLSGMINSVPETREGGHVFFEVTINDRDIPVVAFEPTKHFRDKVRNLREGDEITVQGELDDGTLKLEKFAVHSLNKTKYVNPTCPECGNTMKSAGANAGYRCKKCSTSQESKEELTIDRKLEEGWYEVPPCARRHIAKPLVRDGFDAPVHPFK